MSIAANRSRGRPPKYAKCDEVTFCDGVYLVPTDGALEKVQRFLHGQHNQLKRMREDLVKGRLVVGCLKRARVISDSESEAEPEADTESAGETDLEEEVLLQSEELPSIELAQAAIGSVAAPCMQYLSTLPDFSAMFAPLNPLEELSSMIVGFVTDHFHTPDELANIRLAADTQRQQDQQQMEALRRTLDETQQKLEQELERSASYVDEQVRVQQQQMQQLSDFSETQQQLRSETEREMQQAAARANDQIETLQVQLALKEEVEREMKQAAASANEQIETLQAQLALKEEAERKMQQAAAVANDQIQTLQAQLALKEEAEREMQQAAAVDNEQIQTLQAAANMIRLSAVAGNSETTHQRMKLQLDEAHERQQTLQVEVVALQLQLEEARRKMKHAAQLFM